MFKNRIHVFLVLTLGLHSCTKNDGFVSLPVTGGEPPSHFPAPVYPFDVSQNGDRLFALGKKLFFDKNLSLDSTISCGSCHKSAGAFSDPGMAKSTGVFGETGIRNAPALYNLAWKPAFMWDGGIVHLEFQPLAPLTDQKEMAMSIPLVLERIKQNDEYISLFFEASGSTEISSQLVFQAFARFLASLVSDDSNYDQFIRGNANALSNSELKGLKLFRKLCESCHKEPLFSDFSFRNNGIEPLASDSGRVRITLLPQDRFKFLVPSLRNIGFSAPYMHDGRFKTLDEVIEHYASHEYYSGGADEKLPRQTISADEKEALKAFLLSLNDYSFVNNKAFSEF